MSIKTLRKRIALVAVSALGFGVMTSVSPANAIAIASMVNDTVYISTFRDIDGTANAAATTAGLTSSMTSVGWSSDTSATSTATTGSSSGTAVYVNGGNFRTANVLAGAQLAFTAKGASTSGHGLSVVVTGGTLSQLTATAQTTVTLVGATNINSGFTTVTVDESGTEIINGVFTISGAVGSTATLSIYTGDDITGLTTSTSGTLQGQYTFTVISSSIAGTYSAADSTISQQACLANSASSGNATSNSYDTTTRCRNAYVGVIYVDLEDPYGAAITGASGGVTLTAAASAGKVIISDTATYGSVVNGASTGYDDDTSDSDTDGSWWVYVSQPTANTAGSSTVTISINGSVIATKTINWEGQVATLVIDAANSSANLSTNQADNTTNVGAAGVVYVAKDAAGNVVTLASQPSVYSATGALVGSTTSTTTNSSLAALQTSTVGYGYTMLVIPDNPLSGAGAYKLYLTNASGATIISNEMKVTVSRGGTDSFAISWDKASYNFGDIATLTITAKDAYGNPMADGTTLAGLDLTVSTGGFSAVGAACTSSSYFVAGKKTCKYAALNTEGSYAYSVDLTTATAQSASVGTLPVKASSATVSNAEVLAAIVKLIASINKQISKLQKLIKK